MKKILVLTAIIYNIALAMSGEDIVNQYGCMECHGIKKGKTAPAFEDIAKKSNSKRMKESIKNGSQGKYKKFTQNIMPEFNYFTNSELENISKWIESLKNGK